jgi:hypothetical protein
MGADNLLLETAKPTVNISPEAECYAREHGLLASLIAMKSLVLRGAALIAAVDVSLLRDPEIANSFVITFTIQTAARVSDFLEFDRRLRDSMFDDVPAGDRPYFAVRANFD